MALAGNSGVSGCQTDSAYDKGADRGRTGLAVGNRYLWQGREYSWKTGLYFHRARWRDPVTGRWLSRDPIGISGGLNQYVAMGNDPVNFRDPLGECADNDGPVLRAPDISWWQKNVRYPAYKLAELIEFVLNPFDYPDYSWYGFTKMLRAPANPDGLVIGVPPPLFPAGRGVDPTKLQKAKYLMKPQGYTPAPRQVTARPEPFIPRDGVPRSKPQYVVGKIMEWFHNTFGGGAPPAN